MGVWTATLTKINLETEGSIPRILMTRTSNNLAIMEREAGEAQALQEEQERPPRQEKQNHTHLQPFPSWRSRIGHSHARCARALGRFELGASRPRISFRFP